MSNLNPSEPRMPTAVVMAQTLVRREREKGLDALAARDWLARKLLVGVGTAGNLIRGRVKRVDDTIRGRLHVLLMRELEAEIGRLSHELAVLKQSGAHLASDEISEVESLLQKARAILEGTA